MRGKAYNVVMFDFKGRRLPQTRSVKECAREIGVHTSTIYRLLKTGKPLVKNGMTFDSEEEE